MMRPMSQTETAAELIDALMLEGEEVDAGSFSVDQRAARDKMEAFQYADRSAYLLPLAEAAFALGARRLELSTRGPDLVFSAEGVSLDDPLAGLAGLEARALTTQPELRERALSRLSVGLDMVLGSEGLGRAVISYDTGVEVYVAEYTLEREGPRLSRGPTRTTGELLILLDYRGLGLSSQRTPELERLREAIEFASTPVFIDGERVNHDPVNWIHRGEGQGQGFRYEASRVFGSSKVELWANGVLYETLNLEHGGFVGRLHLEAPRRDLSQMKLIHDETVEAGLAKLEQVRVQLIRENEEASRQRSERKSEKQRERDELIRRNTEQFADQLAQMEAVDQSREAELNRRFPPLIRKLAIGAYGLALLLGPMGIVLSSEKYEGGRPLLVVALVFGISGSWIIPRGNWQLAAGLLFALLMVLFVFSMGF